MKKIFLILATLLASAPALAAVTSVSPGLPTAVKVRDLLNHPSFEAMRMAQMGTQIIDHKVHVLRAVYDFSKQGGAVGIVNLQDEDGKDAVLPKGAIIKQVICHVITAVTSGGAATVSLGANTAVDLLAATAKATFSLDALVAGIPVSTAATSVRTTAKEALTASIAVAALTAGKIECFNEYFLGN